MQVSVSTRRRGESFLLAGGIRDPAPLAAGSLQHGGSQSSTMRVYPPKGHYAQGGPIGSWRSKTSDFCVYNQPITVAGGTHPRPFHARPWGPLSLPAPSSCRAPWFSVWNQMPDGLGLGVWPLHHRFPTWSMGPIPASPLTQGSGQPLHSQPGRAGSVSIGCFH